jgi:hypothetical protein
VKSLASRYNSINWEDFDECLHDIRIFLTELQYELEKNSPFGDVVEYECEDDRDLFGKYCIEMHFLIGNKRHGYSLPIERLDDDIRDIVQDIYSYITDAILTPQRTLDGFDVDSVSSLKVEGDRSNSPYITEEMEWEFLMSSFLKNAGERGLNVVALNGIARLYGADSIGYVSGNDLVDIAKKLKMKSWLMEYAE